MTTKRSLRSWPRSSISLKTSIIGSDFIRPLATCRRLSLKPRFHHKYFLNYLCHFRGALHIGQPRIGQRVVWVEIYGLLKGFDSFLKSLLVNPPDVVAALEVELV